MISKGRYDKFKRHCFFAVYLEFLVYGCSPAVIAANAQGTAGIERTLLGANPNLTLRSTGLLPVVLGIEAGEDPDTLVKQNRLPELVNWYQALGAEALVLGCTHFPYFKEALLRQITLPVIDPAEEMLRLLNI